MMTAMHSPASLATCAPRWATPRRDRPSLGHELAVIAMKLGLPFMPWQRLVADVGLELLPNGLPAYRTGIFTVPRQSGKTTARRDRPSLGHELAVIAMKLGLPFMPWQRLVADVGLELLPNGSPSFI